MNDMLNWSEKMGRIGAYKRKQTRSWLERTSLHQRVRMTEELLLMESLPSNGVKYPPLFTSLSKMLEKRYASS